MKIAATLITIAMLISNVPASAKYAWVGFGTATCGEFAALYRQDPTDIENLFFGWAQGFMSGLNTSRLGTGKTVDLEGAERLQRMIRAYCDANPLKQFVSAVLALYDKLAIEQGVPGFSRP